MSIYEKYCNDIQNPALGAFVIASFIKAFKKNSQDNQLPNLVYVFISVPILMNTDCRKFIRDENPREGVRNIDNLMQKMNGGKPTFGTLYKNIQNYKEYTLTSIIFGLRTGLLSLKENAELDVEIELQSELDEKVFSAAEKLGKLFAMQPSLKKFVKIMGVSI